MVLVRALALVLVPVLARAKELVEELVGNSVDP